MDSVSGKTGDSSVIGDDGKGGRCPAVLDGLQCGMTEGHANRGNPEHHAPGPKGEDVSWTSAISRLGNGEPALGHNPLDDDDEEDLWDAVARYRRDHPEPEPDHGTFKFFEYHHLPPNLQEISSPFRGLALIILTKTKPGHEQTKALDRLLEAKDAAVRAAL